MNRTERKQHWEDIYKTKSPESVSWYQKSPQTSLDYFKKYKIDLSHRIIDIGAGDSRLVDHLLDLGYTDITVLDISQAALEKAQHRLGERSDQVKWIVSDITAFAASESYDVWHDRAAFHFLTSEEDIKSYVNVAHQAIAPGGTMIIGTFSDVGPKKCSGIPVHQYSESTLTNRFTPSFNKIECNSVDHHTPFDTVQNFVFCSFKHH